MVSCSPRSASVPPWAPPLLAVGSSSTATIESLKVQVPSLLNRAGIPGLALAVIANNHVAWSGGFGVADTKTLQPVSASTIFEGASLGKPVVATVALQLVETGQLNLDRPIARDFEDPDFANDALYKRVTLRHLLSHSAGLPNVRLWPPLKIYFQPGDHFSYSGVGFSVVQHLVEHVTGELLDAVASRLVFGPAGMTNSSYVWQARFDGRAAVGYTEDGKPMPKRKPTTAFAPASLQTTAEDYGKFLSALLGGRLLPAPALTQMLTQQIAVTPGCVECLGPAASEPSSTVFWGLGWGLDRATNGQSVWQWGDNDAFRAYAVMLPERKAGLVYFANSQNGLAVRNDLVSHVLGGEHPDWDCVKYDQYDSPTTVAKKSIQAAFAKSSQAGAAEYQRQKAAGHVPADETYLDLLGFKMLNQRSPQAAIAVWELEAQEFPKSWHAYDSLGLAYRMVNERDRSLSNYRRALALNPSDENAKKALAGDQ
jgi:CubicO group peptidase (beta-lactamase class C family)